MDVSLLRIALRRSYVIWFLPVFLLAAWALGRELQPEGLTIWPALSGAIATSTILTGPIAGGLASWVASRYRVGSTRIILDSLPRRGLSGYAVFLIATIGWCLVGYGLYVAWQSVMGLNGATWGGLDWYPVALGGLVIVGCVSLGYAAGLAFPVIVTPVLVVCGLFLTFVGLQQLESSSIRYLSPVPFFGGRSASVTTTYWPTIALPFTVWWVGISGIAVSVILLVVRHRRFDMAVGIAAAGMALLGAAQLVALPAAFAEIPRAERQWDPVCSTGVIAVCVHPAYRSSLDETVRVAEAVFGPVAALPGIPERVDQFSENIAQPLPIYFPVNGTTPLIDFYVQVAVNASFERNSDAQAAIGWWLARQSGDVPLSIVEPILFQGNPASGQRFEERRTAIMEAVERFEALPADARRDWLETNWTRLRAAELNLSELP